MVADEIAKARGVAQKEAREFVRSWRSNPARTDDALITGITTIAMILYHTGSIHVLDREHLFTVGADGTRALAVVDDYTDESKP